MDNCLEESVSSGKNNRRNGKIPKEVQAEYRPVDIETLRDRDGLSSPETVKERQAILVEGLPFRSNCVLSSTPCRLFGHRAFLLVG